MRRVRASCQLFGGVNMSFYDWYADLPTSFPEIWGDQTDVCESADWYNSKFIVSMASNLNMTRTPDVHFIAEARTEGTKFVVLSPDFSQVAKYCDEWIPIQAGQDGALWMAVNHVILKEFYVDRQVPYFLDYLKRYTDLPFLVELDRDGKGYRAGQLLRAKRLARYKDVENGDWKMLVLDAKSAEPRMPKGQVGLSLGFRKRKASGTSPSEDGLDNSPIDAVLSFIDQSDAVVQVEFDDFANGVPEAQRPPWRAACRCGASPPRRRGTGDHRLRHADRPVRRGPRPRGRLSRRATTTKTRCYTPAWQERITGIGRETVIRFAREFARNAELTQGKFHGHRGRQRQPLVLQQSLLPLGHHRADSVRLLWTSTAAG